MKIKCINNKLYEDRLTINKIYEVIENEYIIYKIKNDKGEEQFFVKKLFEVIMY